MRSLIAGMLLVTCVIGPVAITGAIVRADDHSEEQLQQRKLFENLANAQNEREGQAAEAAMWQYWFNQAPTAEIRASLDAGMKRREAYDYEAAENHLDQVVEASPLYAEGYNQRAFVRFLRENYSGSRDDLEKTLELEPNHFGALSGLYHILRLDNRHLAALGVLTEAVSIHPWLKERGALPEEMWPESYRDIHEPGQKI